MKKIAIIFVSLMLLLCLAFSAHAAVVTTTPQESTAASTAQSSDGMIYEVDTTLPVAACIVAVGTFIVYGIVKIKKAEKEEK